MGNYIDLTLENIKNENYFKQNNKSHYTSMVDAYVDSTGEYYADGLRKAIHQKGWGMRKEKEALKEGEKKKKKKKKGGKKGKGKGRKGKGRKINEGDNKSNDPC